MTAIYASEERFWGADDSQTIQNAVDYAEETGLGQVIIPRFNERTGKPYVNVNLGDKEPALGFDGDADDVESDELEEL